MASSNLTFWEAKKLAMAGTKIRRDTWVDRWWRYEQCLWWLEPFNAVTKVAGASRVLLATDITRAEFLATDWTTVPYVAPTTTTPITTVTPTTTATTTTNPTNNDGPTTTTTATNGTWVPTTQSRIVTATSGSMLSTTTTPQIVGWNVLNWGSEIAAGRAVVSSTGMLTWYWSNGGAVRMRVQLSPIYA